MNMIFQAADILLPKDIQNPEKAKKWAVIACDQFTSEAAYWEETAAVVGDCPSTLRMILPEVYLEKRNEDTLASIASCMREYRKSVLQVYPNAMVYVRRTIGNGKVRCGIVGKIDLEAYDYTLGSVSPVRATEGTVLERIPPRVDVRRAATLEAPHVMLLIDDAKKKVIEPLADSSMQKLYDFDLMQNGGHIEGYLLTEDMQNAVLERLANLFLQNGSCLQYAVGDGNHSLASAKARYEELKAQIGDAAKDHPLRYALCEIVNLHDAALVFEPIYRLVKTKDTAALLNALIEYGEKCGEGTQEVICLCGGKRMRVSLGAGTHTLTVGTLQMFLDAYKKQHPQTEIDYIHGLESIEKLSAKEDSIGFVFTGMQKEELFSAVEHDGALPRKTFSMGEATEKRYYIECRSITE